MKKNMSPYCVRSLSRHFMLEQLERQLVWLSYYCVDTGQKYGIGGYLTLKGQEFMGWEIRSIFYATHLWNDYMKHEGIMMLYKI